MIAPFGPVPEIVGKLEEKKVLFFFLKLRSFSCAEISVIFFVLKEFFNQNINLVSAAPS